MNSDKMFYIIGMIVVVLIAVFFGGFLEGHKAGFAEGNSISANFTGKEAMLIGENAVYNYTNSLNNLQVVDSYWNCNGTSILVTEGLIPPLYSNGAVLNFHSGVIQNITLVGYQWNKTQTFYRSCAFTNSLIVSNAISQK